MIQSKYSAQRLTRCPPKLVTVHVKVASLPWDTVTLSKEPINFGILALIPEMHQDINGFHSSASVPLRRFARTLLLIPSARLSLCQVAKFESFKVEKAY